MQDGKMKPPAITGEGVAGEEGFELYGKSASFSLFSRA